MKDVLAPEPAALGDRRGTMRKIAGFLGTLVVLFPALLAAQAPPAPATPGPVFRTPFDLKLQVDKKHYYQEHFADIPYVAGNDVYLFAGEHFGINVTITDNQITGIVYQSDPDKSDVDLKFWQEKSSAGPMMMLVTHNKLKGRLLFDALMTIPEKQGTFKTSIIPIEPGLSNYESWPHPIVQLVLRNFRFVERASTAPR